MRRFTWPIILAAAVALPAGCAPAPSNIAALGPNTPGWTGRTVVVGSNSTINGDQQATYWAQKWGIGRQR